MGLGTVFILLLQSSLKSSRGNWETEFQSRAGTDAKGKTNITPNHEGSQRAEGSNKGKENLFTTLRQCWALRKASIISQNCLLNIGIEGLLIFLLHKTRGKAFLSSQAL